MKQCISVNKQEYFYVESSNKCFACDSTCNQCKNSRTDCVNCKAGFVFKLNGSSNEIGTCIQCEDKCSNCVNQPTYCVSCKGPGHSLVDGNV